VRALFFWSAGKQRVWSRRNFGENPRDNFNAGISQGDSLAGIICEKANTLDTEVVQYRGREAEISALRVAAARQRMPARALLIFSILLPSVS
jgi:hypothetical protein